MPPASSTSDGGGPRSRLGEEAIVRAALLILREEGLEAVTMRRVAAALTTGQASLYVYVSGRQELIQAMLERVMSVVPLEPPDRGRWREQLHALLEGVRRALVEHPGLAREALGVGVADERSLLVAENLLGLLRCGEMDDRDAAWASSILPVLTMAAAVGGEADDDDDLDRAFVALPPDRFPNIAALADQLDAGGADERFRFTLDAFLDGLEDKPRVLPPGDQRSLSRSAI